MDHITFVVVVAHVMSYVMLAHVLPAMVVAHAFFTMIVAHVLPAVVVAHALFTMCVAHALGCGTGVIFVYCYWPRSMAQLCAEYYCE